jgi:biopolymer transport protein ExbB
MKFLIPKTAVRTLTFTAILTTLLYLLTPALFSQSSTDTPAKTTQTEIKDAKDAPAATEKPAEAAPKKSPGLVDLFIVGGWSMWPLALSSIIGFGVAFERLYFFFTTKLVSKGYNQILSDKIEEKGYDGALIFLKEKGILLKDELKFMRAQQEKILENQNIFQTYISNEITNIKNRLNQMESNMILSKTLNTANPFQ